MTCPTGGGGISISSSVSHFLEKLKQNYRLRSKAFEETKNNNAVYVRSILSSPETKEGLQDSVVCQQFLLSGSRENI